MAVTGSILIARAHLKQIEWAGRSYAEKGPHDPGFCPVCGASEEEGKHNPDCWLDRSFDDVRNP